MVLDGRRRQLTLYFAILGGLAAGTNYTFGLTSPAIRERLSLTSTQTNIIGISANLGVYLTGPFVGVLVDNNGPRRVLAFGSIVIFLGYISIRAIYIGDTNGLYASVGVPGLMVAEAWTGIGSSSALSGSVNGVAKTFAGKNSGGYMSLVMSAFGISAAFFASLSHLSMFQGNDPTASFLLLLGTFCSVSLILGAVFVRPPSIVEMAEAQGYKVINEDDADNSESDPLQDESRVEIDAVVQESTTPRPSGVRLFKELEFLLLWGVLLLLSGTGLMFINNLGTMAQTLASPSSAVPVATLQAYLVTLLSIFNCGGRLFAGFVSDYFLHHISPAYRFRRIWWLCIISAIFILSQFIALNTTTVETLAYPTILTGFAYGSLFGAVPVLCLEAFGVKSFSGNNGLLSLAPAVGGNLANLVFGLIYDSHVITPNPSTISRRIGAADPSKLCVLGQECYRGAFRLTLTMCSLAMVLSIWAGMRGGKERREKKRDSGRFLSTPPISNREDD